MLQKRRMGVARRLSMTTGLALILTVTAAEAGPKGGIVVGGNAKITSQGNATTIRQRSNRAVIDWQSFDIAPQERVDFQQPSTSAVALNRVRSATPSQIQGALNAPGNVWVVNPNGVLISSTAQINTGGFIATTADIDTDAFMAGEDRFDRPGNPEALVQNEGTITFGEAGLVGLVGPQARNSGVIAGEMGRVVIAGTDAFAVDLAGDGILALPMGTAPELSAINTGEIQADGGRVIIDAATAEGVLSSLVVVDGVIEAHSVAAVDGMVRLDSGGDVQIGGSIDVTGGAGRTGGDIIVTGDLIDLSDTARLDASGEAGGGTIRIGGDIGGRSPLPRARVTVARQGSEIRADAITEGDGGSIVLWSDRATGFFGSITATGGAEGGNGGFTEVSSAGYLDITGAFDLSAPAGESGTLLLDPDTIVVEAAGFDLGPPGFDIAFGDPATGGSGTTSISPDFINSVDGDLVLQAVEDIEIRDPIDNTGTGNTINLTFEAGEFIEVFQDININGAVTFITNTVPGEAASGIFIDGGTTVAANQGLNFQPATGSLLELGADVTLISGAGLVLPDTLIGFFDNEGFFAPGTTTIQVSGGDLTQTDGTTIVEFPSGGLPATLSLDAPGQDIILPATGNTFSELNATGDNITIGHSGTGSANGDLTVRDLTATGDVALTTDSDLEFSIVFPDGSGGFVTSGTGVSIDGNAAFNAEGDITNVSADLTLADSTGFETPFSVDGEADFIAFSVGDGTISDQFFDVIMGSIASDTAGGPRVTAFGDVVDIEGAADLVVEGAYGETSVTATAVQSLDAQSIFTGALTGGGAIAAGGTITLSALDGDLTGSNLFADTIAANGGVPSGIVADPSPIPVDGNLTLDGFEAETISLTSVTGDLTLANGSVDVITVETAAALGAPGSQFIGTGVVAALGGPVATNITLTNLDLVGPDALSFEAGSIATGGTLTLNGVRGPSLTGEVPNLALGFLEVGSIDITSTGNIVKIPDADLDAGQAGTVVITAPTLTNAPTVADRSVVTGAAFTNLIAVSGTTDFNGALTAAGGDILLPHGEAGSGAFHNDFVGAVTVGPAQDVVIEDANAITIVAFGSDPFSAAAIRGNSDGVGADGTITADFSTTGDAAFLTTDDISVTGSFGGLQLFGANATVLSFGETLTINDSRLSGTLDASFDSALATHTLTVEDTEVAGDLLAALGVIAGVSTGATGDLALNRVVVGGALDGEAPQTVGLTDTQVTGDATLAATDASLTRVRIDGVLTVNGATDSVLNTVTIDDGQVGGALTASATTSVAADGLDVGGATTLSAGTSIALSDGIFTGVLGLDAPTISLSGVQALSGLSFADGLDLTLSDLSITGDFDTGNTASLSLARLSVDGNLTATATGSLAASDLSATGNATFSAASYDIDGLDAAGTASFANAGSLNLTDGSIGTLNLGTQGVLTGARILADSLTGESLATLTLVDLQVTGTTDLTAASTLSLTRFVIGNNTLVTPAGLSLQDGSLGTNVPSATTTTPATVDLANITGGDLSFEAAGDIRLAGVDATSLALTSQGGSVLLGQTVSGSLTATAPFGAISTQDATDNALFGTELADFTVLGPGELLLPGAITELANLAGPGDGAPATIGIPTTGRLGDSTPARRVFEVVAAVDGAAGRAEIPAEGTLAAPADVTVDVNEPAVPTALSVTGSSILSASGAVTLTATNTGATPSENFLGPVDVTSDTSVTIEADDLGNGVVVVSAGDVSLTSDAGVLLGGAEIAGALIVRADADAAFGTGPVSDGAVTLSSGTVSQPIEVAGALIVTQGGGFNLVTGAGLAAALGATGLARDVTLDNPGNRFGGSVQIADITGSITLVEEQAPSEDLDLGTVLAFQGLETGQPGLEALGDISVTTTDQVELRGDTTLAGGTTLRIDTGSGNAAILILGALRAEGTGAAPNVALDAGNGTISIGGLVGIGADGSERALGTVTLGPAGTVVVSAVEPNGSDVFIADRLVLNGVTGNAVMAVPDDLAAAFALTDTFFGLRVGSLDFSGSPNIQSLELFGSIDGDATIQAALLPTGEEDETRLFNGCVIGDLSTCQFTVVPAPLLGSIIEDEPLEDEAATVVPLFDVEQPLFGLPTVDFATLFSATGNETLWSRTGQEESAE
ncbi:MAG: filamentous hemagglutinin N-terminal domain-containing protein [Pseudomonadota bacterium]